MKRNNSQMNDTELQELTSKLIAEIIRTRHERGISQKQLEILSGVKQPIIARLEIGTVNPNLSTLMKLLSSMGKTLTVVPIEQANVK